MDFPLKPNYDESQIGELAGILETLIASVPWNQIPLPIYHSHNVDIVNGEAANTKALRVTLFSQMDVQEAMAGMLNQPDGGTPLKDTGSGDFKLEFPVGVSDLKDPAFRLTPDKLSFRLVADGKINMRSLESAKEALAQMNPMRAYIQGMRNATAVFMKGFDLTFNFADLGELIKDVPDFQMPPPGAGGPARLRAHRGVQPSGLQNMKHGLDQLASLPVAQTLTNILSQLPPIIQQTGQAPLYEAVRNNIIGLGKIHLQANDFVLRFGIKGLDVIQLLPALN